MSWRTEVTAVSWVTEPYIVWRSRTRVEDLFSDYTHIYALRIAPLVRLRTLLEKA